MAEDYELLPHKLISSLKEDVELLKNKLSEPDSKVNELVLEIESLKDSIHELHLVFQKALENTKENDVFETIQQIERQIKKTVEQNETIAQGMVAISDKVDEFINKSAQPHPAFHAPRPAHLLTPNVSPPSMPRQMTPPIHTPGMPSPSHMPPPPPHMPPPHMPTAPMHPPMAPPPPPPSPGKKGIINNIFQK